MPPLFLWLTITVQCRGLAFSKSTALGIWVLLVRYAQSGSLTNNLRKNGAVSSKLSKKITFRWKIVLFFLAKHDIEEKGRPFSGLKIPKVRGNKVSKKYFLLTILNILMAIVIYGVGQACADNYNNYLITKNSYGKYPNINDNGEIVWMGENGKIYLYSNNKISIIANQGKYFDINNNRQITYANEQIYLYQNGLKKI
jgi:hypothetical protein